MGFLEKKTWITKTLEAWQLEACFLLLELFVSSGSGVFMMNRIACGSRLSMLFMMVILDFFLGCKVIVLGFVSHVLLIILLVAEYI